MGAGMVTVGASWYAFETSRGRTVQAKGKRDEDLKVGKMGQKPEDQIKGRREGGDIIRKGGLEKRSVSTRRRKL